jgi:hypothetical protein
VLLLNECLLLLFRYNSVRKLSDTPSHSQKQNIVHTHFRSGVFLENLKFSYPVEKIPDFTEPECSLPYSQKSAIGSYSQPTECNHPGGKAAGE